MKRVLVLVEGQTEEVFANELLAPHLLLFDVHLAPVVVATKRPAGAPKEAGGISSWTQVRREVQLLLRDSSLDCVTTMIDYYGLPADWPGWAGRPSRGAAAVAHLEASMARCRRVSSVIHTLTSTGFHRRGGVAGVPPRQ